MILAGIDLPDAVFTNEFENSAMSQEIKHTEDGRKFIFLKRKNHSVDPIISCDWLTYAQLKQLSTLRDNGTVTTLVLTDKTMAVLINSVFMSLTFWLFHFMRRRLKNPSQGYLGLIFAWISFEFLHHHWDLNWPWLSLGNGFSAWPSWMRRYRAATSAPSTAR